VSVVGSNSSFFFSSRRRHTRFSRDWSSDVCSSDLLKPGVGLVLDLGEVTEVSSLGLSAGNWSKYSIVIQVVDGSPSTTLPVRSEIGRASCRERVEFTVVRRS